jgi:hypothetical protein
VATWYLCASAIDGQRDALRKTLPLNVRRIDLTRVNRTQVRQAARPGGRARRYPHGPRMMPGYRGARASQSRRRVHEGSSPASCFGPPTLPLGARPTRRYLDIGPSCRRCGLDTHQNHDASSPRRIRPRSFVAESSCHGSASRLAPQKTSYGSLNLSHVAKLVGELEAVGRISSIWGLRFRPEGTPVATLILASDPIPGGHRMGL